jgi:branched-chain amino acid aminotransferase
MTTLWVNGRLVPEDEPSVSALDHGLTVGDGVFETLRVLDGRPFALTRHLDRLDRSAGGLGLPTPDRAQVREACDVVVSALPRDELHRLRITYTGGRGPLGSDRTGAEPTLVVAASPAPRWSEGMSIALAPWPRNERGPLTGLKTTSYADNVVALARAKEHGAVEALFANTRGELCEATGSNVFVVVDGAVRTPPLDSGCLAGISRALVIEWCAAEGVEVREEAMPLSVLEHADEVFITSSIKDVMPVSAVDGRSIPWPGPMTAEVRDIWDRRSAQSMDP